jgi:uncharacterized protein
MTALRVVLDSNVFISAVISPLGKPFACLSWVLDSGTLVASRELIAEVETRLARPKFAKYVDEARRRAFIADVQLTAILVELTGTLKACRDPDDDKLLETAIIGNADYLVTGDQDLLVLNPFQSVEIVTPAQFLAAVQLL